MTRRVEDEVGSFLARWSRRKAAARRGAPEPEPPPPVPRAAEEAAGPKPDEGEPAEVRTAPQPRAENALPELDLAKLPDPETLDATSDFSVFMQPGVPAELRRRALRRLWKVNPIISTPDGLDDYYVVNDFSDASTVVADLKTLYRVGRGMIGAFAEADEPGGEAAHVEQGGGAGEPEPGEARLAGREEPAGVPLAGEEPSRPPRELLRPAEAEATKVATPEGELGRQGSADRRAAEG